MNLWAGKETNGLNKDLLSRDSIMNLTQVIFANAFYFKGVWDRKFDASLSKE